MAEGICRFILRSGTLLGTALAAWAVMCLAFGLLPGWRLWLALGMTWLSVAIAVLELRRAGFSPWCVLGFHDWVEWQPSYGAAKHRRCVLCPREEYYASYHGWTLTLPPEPVLPTSYEEALALRAESPRELMADVPGEAPEESRPYPPSSHVAHP